MYIAPNTTVILYKNCPLDKSYNDTIYFASLSAQTAYFQTLTGYAFTGNSYQRVNSNKIRVAMNAESLYNCNYLAFQNASFGTKWFYAFINSVDYINNVTSEITYEIDVIQTWHFDYLLRQCLIERAHTLTDGIGDNLVPENLELGDYVSKGTATGVISALSSYTIVVAATFTNQYVDSPGDKYGGIYSGLLYHTFPNNDLGIQLCQNFISGAVSAGKANGIVAVFLMPTATVTSAGGAVAGGTFTMAKLDHTALDGYIPKNKKLYTYPFNFLYVTNMQGNAAAFHYEYFSTTDCQFQYSGDMSPNPSVVLTPKNYKGESVNWDEKMVLSGFPQISYNTDSFKAWLAQNGASLAVNAISTAGAVAANPIAGAMGAAGIVAQVYEHSIMPNQAHGGAGSTTNCALGLQNFLFMQKHIRGEFAAIIDKYFDMFGYALHQVAIPVRDARPEWTYVKTIGCKIDPTATSGLPGDDMVKIENIYNNGIRWWKNAAHIGDYSYSNAPVTPGT